MNEQYIPACCKGSLCSFFVFFVCMFAFIIFHSSSLSNVDKIPTFLYIRGSSVNWLKLHKLLRGREGLRWAEIWWCRLHPTPIHSRHPTASHHWCPPVSSLSFLPRPGPFSLLHPEWSKSISPVLFQPCCPSLAWLPQSLGVSFSDWLMLCPLTVWILWHLPQPPPHWFLPICPTAAPMAPPDKRPYTNPRHLSMTSSCLSLS